ncbi:MAG: hypothetical protein CMLOHMNK_00714 [Steroidobacteraceae bacterium]|nr:hypothetical protein [Steroidobacteraceae bacterium]
MPEAARPCSPRLAGLLAAGALLCACTGPAPPATPRPEISQLLVLPGSLHLGAGEAANLAAQANDSTGAPIGGAQFTFAADDARTLRVSQTGRVIALGPVTPATFVTVSSERLTRRVPVSVRPGRATRLEAPGSDDRRVTAGEFPGTLELHAVDAWGNDVPATRIEVVVPRREATVLTGETDEAGRAAIDLPAFERAGRRELIARLADDASVQLRLPWVVEPGAAEALSVLAEIEGSHVRVLATLKDAYSNAVPDATVRLRIKGVRAGKWVDGRTDAQGSARFVFDLPSGVSRAPPVILAEASRGAGVPLTASVTATASAKEDR